MRIPRRTENVRMNDSAPVEIAQATTAAFQARDKVASSLMQFAAEQEATDRKINVDAGANAIKNLAEGAKANAMKMSAPDGSNYGQIVGDSMKDADKVINEFSKGDRYVQKQLQAYKARVDEDLTTDSTIAIAAKMENFNYQRVDALGIDSANRIRENPKENLLAAEGTTYNNMINSITKSPSNPTGSISPENAVKIKKAYAERAAGQLIEGLGNSKQFSKAITLLGANHEDPSLYNEMAPQDAQKLGLLDPDEAKAMLDKGETYKSPVMSKGKIKLGPVESAIMNSLPPAEKARLIDKYTTAAKAESAMRMTDLNADIEGFVKLSMSGEVQSADGIRALKNQINSTEMPIVAKKRLHDKINTANAVAHQAQLAANTPRDQWGKLLTKAGDAMNMAGGSAAAFDPRMADDGDFAIKANRKEAQEAFVKTLEGIRAKQDADAAQFVATTDQQANTLWKAAQSGAPDDIQKYANYTTQKQAMLGISPDKIRVLPEAAASQVAVEIKAQPDARQTNAYIEGLQIKYGPNFNKVMGEIAGTDPLLKNYKTLALVNSKTRTNLVDAMKNEPAIKKAIASDEVLKTVAQDIDYRSTNIIQGFKGALAGVSSDSASVESVNSVRELVSLHAQRALVQNPNAKPEQLVAQAYQDVVGSNFAIVDGGTSTVLVPRKIGTYDVSDKQAQIVGAFMDVYSNKRNIPDLGVYIPKDQDPDIYLDRVAKTSVWVTNEDQTGLMYVTKNIDGSSEAVTDKFGKRIERSYDDIYIRPDKKTNDRFLGRVNPGDDSHLGQKWNTVYGKRK